MDLKSLLNKEQYDGAITINGPVLILAGAGSGKTRVLTYRMAHMIEDLGVLPYKILAITFTNKAAKEMKERVQHLIGDRANDMWISTFHSTCVKILRREIEKIGYKKSFTIYDTSDQKTLLKECMKVLKVNDKDITEQEILSKISKAKDNMKSADAYYRESEHNFREKKIAEVYQLYQKRLKENNALDFDDLIFKTVEIFKKHEDVLEFYQRKFQYIMVDEYQDTNGVQYEFVRLLAMKHNNICVVGDDDQCIYQWRGADIKNILGFEKDYPNAKVIKLEQNYRSKANILDSANAVIVNNSNRKSKALRTEQESGEKIKIYRAYSDSDEGTFVANQILKISKEQNKEFKDFAILYRTNAQSRIFEESLRRATVPYKIIGGTRFYDRKEIKDMLSYLKVLVNPEDSVALKRIINVPKRGIGDATIQKVLDFANSYEISFYDALTQVRTIPTLTARNCAGIENFMEMIENLMILSETIPVSNLIEGILKDSGYMKELENSKEIEDKSRIENLKELVSDAVDFEKVSEDKSLSAYLEKVSLVQDTDKLENEEDVNGQVVLMTVHSAKGLEFPVVFMVGMENGIFPGAASFDSESEMEESRRLCYVGITRAKEKLFITSAEVRRVFGRTVCYPQSDFIAEIKPELREYVTMTGEVNNNQGTKRQGFNSQANSNPHSLRATYTPFENNRFANKVKPATNTTQSSNNSLLQSEATIGRKVKHDKFGVGTIVSVTEVNGDKKLTIAFNNQGVKMLMLSLAKLEML